LRSYGAGDSAAFETLYKRHKDGLYNFILRGLAQALSRAKRPFAPGFTALPVTKWQIFFDAG